MKEKKFLCIAGKNNIAVNVLKYLIANNYGYELGVVCNKTDTGENGFQESLKCFAEKNSINEYKLEDIYEIDNIVFLSLEFDRIIKPEKFLNARLYNIHFSLLPKYKGMFTSVFPILNGDHETGVTLHEIDAGIDTGNIIAQKSFPIGMMDCREVYLSYIKHGTALALENIDKLLSGNVFSVPQAVYGSTYNSRQTIDFDNIIVNLNNTAEGIFRQIRAYNFREYQLPKVNGRAIVDCRYTTCKSIKKPGKVLFENQSGCIISTIDYDIILYYDRLDELITACKEGDTMKVYEIACVRKLINAVNLDGRTPLEVAVSHGRKDIAMYLMMNGAKMDDGRIYESKKEL